jgi:aldehyde:ferredoxin oxidoreductase
LTKGYNNKILRVNLTKGSTSVESLDDLTLRRFVGGAGLVTYFLYKELKPKTEPLSPENKLIMAGGPLTGLPLSGSGRNCVGAISPQSNGLAKSEVGGFFGAEMMHAGYDVIIVEGRSPKPVYLWIKDGVVEIRDAARYWGKTTKETQDGIRAELGDERIRLAMIGPGGENLVKFACVINDLKEAAGRGGTGAVMGSKNLKAIAVRGTKPPEMANPDVLGDYRQWLMDNKALWAQNADFGTGAPAGMISGLTMGNLPVRNFRDGEFPNVAKITAGAVKDTVRVGMEGCYACVVRCKKMVKIDEPGMQVDPEYGGPEYETLASLGSTCGVDDLKAICKGNELCGAYSLDTIATGTSIGFAMEAYERGLLTNKDTGGLELKFGSAAAMLKAIELIAHRQGIGDFIAEGTKPMAEKLGHGSEAYAMNVKGVEFPMHDPRAGKVVLGLGYAINPHGADHCLNMHDTMMAAPSPQLNALHSLGVLEPIPGTELSPRKVFAFHALHTFSLLRDSAVCCSFVPFTIEQVVQLIKASTGWDTGTVEMTRVSDRIFTLARMLNLRQGLTAEDDKLPERVFQQHIGGPSANSQPYLKSDFEKARAYYYRMMGWDEKGVPTPETLTALDIGWAAAK